MRRLYRSPDDKKIFGICGGIGEFYDIDPTFIRIATVFLCIITAGLPILACYFIAWIIIPEKP